MFWGVLRQRYVLSLIFGSSLLYFLFKTGLLNLAVFGSSRSMRYRRIAQERVNAQRRIQWYEGVVTGDAVAANNATQTKKAKCRNTKQGRTLIADDRGFTCRRADVKPSGCCAQNPLIPLNRFDCSACNSVNGCCSSYEGCVSCCMRPDQKAALENVLRQVSGSRLRLFAAVNDQFELCSLKCRTSSNSVHHENRYKNDRLKYCYALEPKLPFNDTK